MAFPFLDKSRASYVDFRNITGPVLVITGSEDKMTVSAIARKTAHNYKEFCSSLTKQGPIICTQLENFKVKPFLLFEHR